jgi:DNA modification methylase
MEAKTDVAGAPLHPIVTMPFTPYFDEDGITIYLGDCKKILPWLGSVDLLLTDPPYGIMKRWAKKNDVNNKTRFHTRFDDDCEWDSAPPEKEVFDLAFTKSKDRIVCGANYFVYALPVSRGWVFWDKQGDGMSSVNNELIFTSLDRSIMTFSRCHGLDKGFMNKDGAFHPTQKPTALMRWCLSLVPEAQTVLDPFMGSGTTLVAARLEGRKAIGIEISERYCEAAVKRLAQKTLF